jgi:hypothetical protein
VVVRLRGNLHWLLLGKGGETKKQERGGKEFRHGAAIVAKSAKKASKLTICLLRLGGELG